MPRSAPLERRRSAVQVSVAYANYIAVVDWSNVLELRAAGRNTVAPLSVVAVSQLTAYWEKIEPLASCLVQILDGGEELSVEFWHPFRVPKVHPPAEVKSLQVALRNLTQGNKLDQAVHGPGSDLEAIQFVLDEAVKCGAAVLSVLEPPVDEERARRVACPFAEPDNLPIPWGSVLPGFEQFK